MALHESEDTVTKNGLTVLDARRKLERIIADRMNGSADDLDYTAAEIFYEETENEKHSMESSRVRAWIDEIYEDSKQVCWVGERAYVSPVSKQQQQSVINQRTSHAELSPVASVA
ncbi:hypothetical protein PV328_012346 [Microctonus aethiopoides]|uniref:Uncharacterized protein n=1 Tax=Microctonus aethiopoides TaxID=144406 RepID=A0AA39FGK9_9HYME|nr:hypothetical protein PV328_012346 [Microctonus aethiopoides]